MKAEKEYWILTPEARLVFNLQGAGIDESISIVRQYGDERAREAFLSGWGACNKNRARPAEQRGTGQDWLREYGSSDDWRRDEDGRRESRENRAGPAAGCVSVEDRLPEPGVPVIVFVDATREDGGRFTRRLRAQWSDGKSIVCGPDSIDFGEYDEERDEYFCPRGWYETNEFEDTHWYIDDPVTHWQPLPAPPEADDDD